MKKLLSLLTISTLMTSIPTPLLANTALTRVKRDIGTSNSNNDYVPIKEINGITGKISTIAVDKKNNIYYSDYINTFVLKRGSTTPTKIDGIEDDARTILIDNSNNVYFGTNKGLYKLSAGATTTTNINKLSWLSSLAVDSKDNIYIGASGGLHKLSAGSDTPTIVVGIDKTVNSIAVDSKDNIYFGTDNGAFVLKRGSTTPTKIDGITTDGIQSINVDKNNNIYIATFGNGAYKLSAGSDTPTPISGINGKIISFEIDSKNNIFYFIRDGVATEAFVLKNGEKIASKIDGISTQLNSIAVDSKDNIYFGTDKGTYILQTALSWVKTQSQFTLVDSTKTQTWTRNDLIAVDGEVNIDLENPNIDKVVFDNVEQPQTSKQWKINVKTWNWPFISIIYK
ncbi:NHL repeat-containing protein [Spiroplasma poulsonii]|uniref:hypothetical protein n=1 Tax=Spiroplasma poulsonii TaxID=2138 RepID=UPI001F4C7BDE|nr:hypothetical protein [Spiroplasma poulsonii]UNF62723.1 hypothetical protein MNU24_08330 [Spiroplasma poulsonii]